MRLTLLLILVSTFFLSYSQHHTVSGVIDGLPGKVLYLADFYGDQHKIIDSTQTNLSGAFEISLSGHETGFYRLIFGNQKFIDFIYNEETVNLTTNVINPIENIAFSSSVENLLWYDYLFRKEESQYKLDLLNPLLVYYPTKTDFHKSVRAEYKMVQDDFDTYVQSMLDLNTMTYAAKAIRIDKPYLINIDLPLQEQNEYIKAHYFDGISLDDPSLMRSSVISTKIIGYLALYRDPSFSKEDQENNFIQAIDTILYKTMDDDEIFNFTLQYLIDGFNLYGFDKVITHIAEHYQPAEACLHDEEQSELVKRMENIKKLAVGKQAPDIDIIDHNGQRFHLSESLADYNLIVFWASWCTHCQAIMPELNNVYQSNEDNYLEVIAISVDTSLSAYEEAITNGQFKWINYYDKLGWDSRPALDYSIYATPTMFLVDRDRNIIAKPMDLYELREVIQELK